MFFRKIEKRLNEYYDDPLKKIMVINGARQIGKSYIIRETAKLKFVNYIEINLKADYDGPKLFEKISKTRDFYLQLSALYGNKLGNESNTIILCLAFDEFAICKISSNLTP